ncbi:MAG TPA: hypothetical protein VMM93_13185 [Vicinamibacterales bacterium]|nr:hypothetical protein [Vicinamibacterales bacterium]
MTDGEYTAEEARWLKTWDDKLAQLASGAMTADDVCQWMWKDKVLNAINVTLQRMKRAERPGLDARRSDNTWVTVAAERGRRKEDLSALAFQTLAFVYQRLKDRGHEFDVDWMATSNGVVVVSVNVKALREFSERRKKSD